MAGYRLSAFVLGAGLAFFPAASLAQARVAVGPMPSLTPAFYGLGAGLAAPTLSLMGPGLSAVEAPSPSPHLPSVLPTVAAPAAVVQAVLPAPAPASAQALPFAHAASEVRPQAAALPALEALGQELSRQPGVSVGALNGVFDRTRPSRETVENRPLPSPESRLKGPGRVRALPEYRKSQEKMPFASFSPSSIRGGLRRGFVIEGRLNKSVSLSIRIRPGKVEVRKKHFDKPAETWRSASAEEIRGLSAALKRHVDGLSESAEDRPLYLVVYGALLGKETAGKHSLSELRKVKDRLVGFLIHPQVAHRGFQVAGIGLSGGQVVVTVVSEDQIPGRGLQGGQGTQAQR